MGDLQHAEAPKPNTARDGWLECIRHPVFTSAVLLALVAGIYARTGSFDFITHYDDEDYVTVNPMVLGGLTWESVRWAFQTTAASNWHPLTWLSHMLDVQLFGPGPAGPHLVNVCLHAANTLLLFFLLRRFTGAHWRSAIVATFFAVHPLQVESVAWIAERKDVLSTCFALLTLWAFARHVSKSSTVVQQENPLRSMPWRFWNWDYGLSLLFFCCGLMCKPMLVTLPFVMWLLDWWPLRRFAQRASTGHPTIPSLIVEKLPFLLLSMISCVVTVIAQGKGGAVMSLDHLSMAERTANAVISYVRYLEKIFWPVDLAVFYPHPGGWPAVTVGLSALVVVGLSVLVTHQARRFPFGFTGWFWFVGMLVPVIGLVQVGSQSMADRYTYLAKVGIFIVAVWGAAEFLTRWRSQRWANGIATTVTLLALAACYLCSATQVGVWRNAETLFQHALRVTPGNPIAHNNLGTLSLSAGRASDAIEHFRAALRTRPNYVDALGNLGAALAQAGQTDEAVAIMRRALALRPDDAMAHYNLGNALAMQGLLDQAIVEYQIALRLKPDDAEAHANLGKVLMQAGRAEAALPHLLILATNQPTSLKAQSEAAIALTQAGRLAEAARRFEAALQISPGDLSIQNNLAKVLAMRGHYEAAWQYASEVLKNQPTNTLARNTRGYILAQQGKLAEAVTEYTETLRTDRDNFSAHYNLGDLAARLGQRTKAINHFQEALRIKPGSLEAKTGLEALADPAVK